MGVTGLLPFLEKATRPCHVSEFRGGTVVVDSYCFLHKGANACAEQLARGEDNQMYVQYCIKYVKMLLFHNIHPIMVFDGRNLPAKADTEATRRESRKKAKQRAAELLRLGKTDEARTYLKQCVDITPKMAHNLIKECRKLNVDCIVSPYESDAQMAFFNLKGIAECVITEDSDLVLFGCKKVLYKLDLQGAGRLVESDKICMTMKMRPDQFTFDKFRFMCILSGCDYVRSLSGIGLKKAEKFLKLTAETNAEIFLDRIPRYLNMKHLIITEDYKKSVLIANATFLHQIVFDPYKKKLVHLTDPAVTGTNPEYLINAGEKFNDDKAYQVAIGNLNPYNFEMFDHWNPSNVSDFSIWSGIYKKRVSRNKQKELQKASFEKYMSSGKVASTSSKIDEDLHVQEEDNQIEMDLSVYTRKLELNDKTTERETETNVQKQESNDDIKAKLETSPIICKNPFRKKRISKFPKTYTCGNTIVKSRFFNPVSSLKVEGESSTRFKSENDANFNETESFVAECKESLKKHSNSPENKEYCDNSSIEMKVSLIHNSEEVLKSCENTNKHSSQKRCFEDAILTEAIENEKEVTRVFEIDKVKEEITTVSEVTIEVQNDIKRRKLGPCRTVGLKRIPSGQQTLHKFFDKLRDSE